MNPNTLLRNLINPQTPTVSTAVISAVKGRVAYIVDRGKTRAATLRPEDTTMYKAGDTVQVEGSVLIGKTSVRRSKVVYL